MRFIRNKPATPARDSHITHEPPTVCSRRRQSAPSCETESQRRLPSAATHNEISRLAPAHNACLHRFAVLTAIATLGLVGIGGLVTSHGAGMAVPDWPNTYGYNMFCFPLSQWVGGIFYEHTHRLAASGVGLLTVVLALWLFGRNARPFMRWAGAVLLLLGAGTAVAMSRRWADGLVLGLTGLAFLGASRVWPRCEPSAKWLIPFNTAFR